MNGAARNVRGMRSPLLVLATAASLSCASATNVPPAPTPAPMPASPPTASGPGRFVPAWHDDFDGDLDQWQLMTHSWDGNLAKFSAANARVADSLLTIELTRSGEAAKPFRGVELRSLRTLTYGKVEARMRFARGSGVVSGMVLIYTPWPADDWNELDIEHLGKTPSAVQLNAQVYLGPPVAKPAREAVKPTQDLEVAQLGFDAESEFHVYGIEWTPTEARFTVDGKLLRTWNAQIARMKLPQNLLFTIWASDAPGWAGAILPDSAPTAAQVDWVRVYDWKP